jgi:hypothetical protein
VSTTFEVYPQSPIIPSFAELICLAGQRLIEQLHRRDISASPTLSVILIDGRTEDLLPLDLKSPLIWDEKDYAWFYVPGVAGGTDAYCETIDDLGKECWARNLENHAPTRAQRSLVNACITNGRYWYFRRSAGQPGIINFAYGILAAALAELTDGFVYSEDSAWDYARFPATADEFYRWYFIPSMALKTDNAEWARRCLEAISMELRS